MRSDTAKLVWIYNIHAWIFLRTYRSLSAHIRPQTGRCKGRREGHRNERFRADELFPRLCRWDPPSAKTTSTQTLKRQSSSHKARQPRRHGRHENGETRERKTSGPAAEKSTPDTVRPLGCVAFCLSLVRGSVISITAGTSALRRGPTDDPLERGGNASATCAVLARKWRAERNAEKNREGRSLPRTRRSPLHVSTTREYGENDARREPKETVGARQRGGRLAGLFARGITTTNSTAPHAPTLPCALDVLWFRPRKSSRLRSPVSTSTLGPFLPSFFPSCSSPLGSHSSPLQGVLRNCRHVFPSLPSFPFCVLRDSLSSIPVAPTHWRTHTAADTSCASFALLSSLPVFPLFFASVRLIQWSPS